MYVHPGFFKNFLGVKPLDSLVGRDGERQWEGRAIPPMFDIIATSVCDNASKFDALSTSLVSLNNLVCCVAL